ncbi:MAG: hypothetical protein J2P13_12945, partial [Acidobacteria bacterium]|nr:hypothetical protein [Acidobacteriota bacterium]
RASISQKVHTRAILMNLKSGEPHFEDLRFSHGGAALAHSTGFAMERIWAGDDRTGESARGCFRIAASDPESANSPAQLYYQCNSTYLTGTSFLPWKAKIALVEWL